MLFEHGHDLFKLRLQLPQPLFRQSCQRAVIVTADGGSPPTAEYHSDFAKMRPLDKFPNVLDRLITLIQMKIVIRLNRNLTTPPRNKVHTRISRLIPLICLLLLLHNILLRHR